MLEITILVGILLSGIGIGYVTERIAFNKGVCPKCGAKLKHFDNTSQG